MKAKPPMLLFERRFSRFRTAQAAPRLSPGTQPFPVSGRTPWRGDPRAAAGGQVHLPGLRGTLRWPLRWRWRLAWQPQGLLALAVLDHLCRDSLLREVPFGSR